MQKWVSVHLRFEDISQDGRVLLEVLPSVLGPTIWNAQLAHDPLARECREKGIVPILTRYVLEGTPGPFGLMTPMQATGRFELARTDRDRVALNMWAELRAPIGRTYPPQPDNAGTEAVAGRVFAEHVFTRLFAAESAERAVRPADVGLRDAPPYTPRPFAEMLPTGAQPDDAPIVFGLVHTDSNQHVNSLAYLRAFEEAVLRRCAPGYLSRQLEIAYRKPCFAGDRMRVHVHLTPNDAGMSATVALAPDGQPVETAHVAARMLFIK